MEEELKATGHHPADSNGDGRVSDQERDMYLEFKRKELEDQDLMRDAQRKMAWFSYRYAVLSKWYFHYGSVRSGQGRRTHRRYRINLLPVSCRNRVGILWFPEYWY
jgi:hypothetical protein